MSDRLALSIACFWPHVAPGSFHIFSVPAVNDARNYAYHVHRHTNQNKIYLCTSLRLACSFRIGSTFLHLFIFARFHLLTKGDVGIFLNPRKNLSLRKRLN